MVKAEFGLLEEWRKGFRWEAFELGYMQLGISDSHQDLIASPAVTVDDAFVDQSGSDFLVYRIDRADAKPVQMSGFSSRNIENEEAQNFKKVVLRKLRPSVVLVFSDSHQKVSRQLNMLCFLRSFGDINEK